MNLTLIAAAVVYPLLQGAWESGPLPAEYSTQPSAPFHLEEKDVSSQVELFAKASDPIMRGRMAKALSLSSNKTSIKALELLAKAEKDQAVRQDLLSALLALEEYGAVSDQAFLRGLVKSDSLNERVLAAALLGNASKSPSELVSYLSSEKSAYAQNFLWPRIAAMAEKPSAASLEKLLDAQIPELRAGAASALVAQGGAKSSSSGLEKLVSDKETLVRFALASALASGEGGERILEKLAKDSSSSVRAAVALSKPGEGRERILLALSSDPDAAVRRNACEALAACPGDDSSSALSGRLGDKDQFVRAAAERSIGVIKPSRASLDKIEALLEDKASCASAIKALGLAGDREAAPKILAILEKRPDDNLCERAAEALGRLDFKASAKTVASFSGSANAKVRKAAAAALGQLKEQDGFDALRKLAKDQDLAVAREALRSIGLIGGREFEQTICDVLSDVKSEAPRRSAACWAASRADLRSPAAVKALHTLAVVPCVPIPMSSEKAYDGDDVRISALFALSSLGQRGLAPAAESFASDLELLKGPFAKMAGGSSGPLLDLLLEDYVRQLEILRAGGVPGAVELVPVEPELAMKRL